MSPLFSAACRAAAGWAAVMAFLLPLRRKPHFWLRALLFLGAFIAADAAIVLLAPPAQYLPLTAVGFYLLMMAMLELCGQLRPRTAPYCAVWAGVALYLMQDLQAVFSLVPTPGWLAIPLSSLLPIGIALLLVAILGRILPRGDHYEVGPRQLAAALLLGGLFWVIHIAMEAMPPQQDLKRWLLLFSCQLYAATILYLSNTLFRKSALQQELDTLNLLWHQQQTQYSIAKANVQLINRRCHDLKLQVAGLRKLETGSAREAYLKEIETLVQTYDSIVKTGNEVLDTILTQKSTYAEAQNIHLNCVAQGQSVCFIDPVDLYTMLGNALDNAIEYVKGAEEREKRIIDVLVHTRQRFLAITISNPLHSTPVFEAGLPVSTKSQNGYHGFGLKSVRHIAKKYSGFLTIDTTADTFTLRLLLPLPAGLSPSD